nr:tetratricopeptide repeat protein [Prochlorococcus marinus]
MKLNKNFILKITLLFSFIFPIFSSENFIASNLFAENYITNNRIINTKEEAEEEIKKLINQAYKFEEENLLNDTYNLLKQILILEKKFLGENNPQVAATLFWIGEIYIKKGLLKNAEDCYLRALEIEEKSLGKSHSDLAITYYLIGDLYQQQGLYRKAEENFLRALEIEEINQDNNDDLPGILVSLGDLYQQQGLYRKAEENFLRALEIEESVLGRNHPEIAKTLIYLGSFYQQNGLFQKAEENFLRALEIGEKVYRENHPDKALLIGTLGDLYQKKGFYKKAEENFLRALEIEESVLGSDHPNLAVTLASLGNLYKEQGLYQKAEENFIRALTIEKKAFGNNHPYVAEKLIYIGDLFELQGLLNKAEKNYLSALEIEYSVFGADHPEVASTLGTLAILYEQKGLYKKAEENFKRALSIEEKALGEDHAAVANTLAWLGFLYSNQGQYKKGEDYLLSSLDKFKKALGEDHPHIAITYFDLAMFIYARIKDFKKAENLLQDALRINKEYLGKNHSQIALNYKYLGEIYTLQSKYKLAANSNRKSVEILLELIKRELPFLPVSTRRHFSRIIDDSLPKTIYTYDLDSYPIKELALLLRINRQGLSEEIEKIQSKLSLLEGPQKEITINLKEIIKNLSFTKITKKDRQRLNSKKEKLEKELYKILPEIKLPLIEISQISSILKPGEALVEFQRYSPYKGIQDGEKRFGDSHFFGRKQIQNYEDNKSRYLSIILKPNGIIHTIDLGTAEKIDKKINLALLSSEQGLEDAQKLWNDVGELVIKPLKKVLNQEDTLFISPDAQLNRVPFAALSSYKKNMLLGEIVNIRLLTTGRELLRLAKKSKVINKDPLVIANPSFNIIQNFQKKNDKFNSNKIAQKRSGDLLSSNWVLLPGTAKEGKAISEILKSQLLTQNEATALAIQKREKPKIIHIASHAYFLPDQINNENPLLRSGIVLAGANQPEYNPIDDGYLTALEVTKLNWQGTELVVISGCESGKGDIRSGEGIYGLKRAIAVAGSRSSLLSLWKVDDKATADFMEKFYQKLKVGMGRSEALAETQKEFKNHSITRFRHPYYWAAFQLSGDWRPIDF